MAEGETGAVFEGLANDAGDAAGEITDSLAKLSEDAADKEEANLARLLEQDAKAGKDIEDAGKPGEPPPELGGPDPDTPQEVEPPPTYENPGHHDLKGGPNPYNPKKAVLPPDAQARFADSVQVGRSRWAKVRSGKSAVYYRYSNTGGNVWHWSGSTNGVDSRGAPMFIPLDQVPAPVRRM
jgi:hypothetical protein